MNIQDIFSSFFGGGHVQEEETILKGDDVIVELDASLEDLYMGGTMKVWRVKNVLKPALGKRQCNCRNEVYHKQIGPGMFQKMSEQVCEQCSNVKFEREGDFITVDIEKGMQDGHVQALVGFEKTIKHLDEHLVDISFKGITTPKEVKKFKGGGMPLHFSNKKGDLYVKFEVLFPTSLTEAQMTKIKETLG